MTGWRWNVLRAAFLVAVGVGAWWSWRDSGDEVRGALSALSAPSVALSGGAILAGLLITGGVWLLCMRSFGIDGAPGDMVPLFFLAQLGKYIPGSVWAFGAQAGLSRHHGFPARQSAAASFLFVGAHVATGLVVAGALGWAQPFPWWLQLASLTVGAVGLLPAVYRWLGRRLGGSDCGWQWSTSARALGVMAPVWLLYGCGLWVLVPAPRLTDLMVFTAVFALAHGAGLAFPLAPAGLGVREAVIVVLLTPVVGAGAATAAALVARLLHATADFVVAAAAALWLRSRGDRGLVRAAS